MRASAFVLLVFWSSLVSTSQAEYLRAWGDNFYGQTNVPAGAD
jgi:hypothetical protein